MHCVQYYHLPTGLDVTGVTADLAAVGLGSTSVVAGPTVTQLAMDHFNTHATDELLAYLLAFLPLKALVYMAPLVCSKWRDVCLRLVHVPIFNFSKLIGAKAMFGAPQQGLGGASQQSTLPNEVDRMLATLMGRFQNVKEANLSGLSTFSPAALHYIAQRPVGIASLDLTDCPQLSLPHIMALTTETDADGAATREPRLPTCH